VQKTRSKALNFYGNSLPQAVSIEDILWDFPQLTSAQIHDALSYYHDHKKEMDKIFEQASYEHWQPIIERMAWLMSALKIYLNENLSWKIAKTLRENNG